MMKNDILSSLLPEKSSSEESKKRKERAESDFQFFCSTYLSHYFFGDPAPYHGVIYDIISRGELTNENINKIKPLIKIDYHGYLVPKKITGLVDAEPRGFGKSVRLSFAFPLWSLLFQKKKFILLIGASAGAAESNLDQIKAELEENELILEDFGDLKGSVWKSNYLELANDTAIAAKGSGASMRGVKFHQHRPDLVILDDILKDEAAESETQRDKIYSWVKRVIFPLAKDIFLVFVNTIFHSDDIVCRLLSEIGNGSLKNFVGLRFSAITPNGQSLWPAYWPMEKLEEKKLAIGTKAFSTEYQNEPLSSGDQVFKKEWFQFFDLKDINVNDLEIVNAHDPATGAHDRCTSVTVGLDRATGNYYVLDAFGKRLSANPYMEVVIDKYLFWHPKKIGWESVSFQKIYKQYLLERAAEREVYLPIQEILPKGIKKEVRIQSISPLIEAGKVFFKRNQKELLEELETFPKGIYDDLADSLEMAISMLKEGPKKRPMGFPSGPRPSLLGKMTDEVLRRFR